MISERFRSSTESNTFTSNRDNPTVAPMNSVPELENAEHDQSPAAHSRKPDVDPDALEAMALRVFGATTPVTFRRTADGLRTQVYRLTRGGDVFYLRLAED